jgi:small subunit ribosomal protein S8
MQDTTSNALASIQNAIQSDKSEAVISPTSNTIKDTLLLMQQEEYIDVFELVEDGRGNKFKVQLKESINTAKPVKPNFYVAADEFEKWEKRYLPAKDFGKLLLTTSKGILTHEQARDKNVGGKLIGYVY